MATIKVKSNESGTLYATTSNKALFNTSISFEVFERLFVDVIIGKRESLFDSELTDLLAKVVCVVSTGNGKTAKLTKSFVVRSNFRTFLVMDNAESSVPKVSVNSEEIIFTGSDAYKMFTNIPEDLAALNKANAESDKQTFEEFNEELLEAIIAETEEVEDDEPSDEELLDAIANENKPQNDDTEKFGELTAALLGIVAALSHKK